MFPHCGLAIRRIPCVTLLAFLLACSDDGEGTVEPFDPSGIWNFHFVNTQASGVCAGEAHDVSDERITIVSSGVLPDFDVVAIGFPDLSGNQLPGTFHSNHLSLSGSYSEGIGATTSTISLTASSESRMVGTENWSWTGGGETCLNGKATVTATRVN